MMWLNYRCDDLINLDAQAFLLPLALARPQVGFSVFQNLLKPDEGTKKCLPRLATTSTATRTCLPSTRLLSRSLWLLLLHQDSLRRYKQPLFVLTDLKNLHILIFENSLNSLVCSLSGNKALESERRPVLAVVARRTARNRVN